MSNTRVLFGSNSYSYPDDVHKCETLLEANEQTILQIKRQQQDLETQMNALVGERIRLKDHIYKLNTPKYSNLLGLMIEREQMFPTTPNFMSNIYSEFSEQEQKIFDHFFHNLTKTNAFNQHLSVRTNTKTSSNIPDCCCRVCKNVWNIVQTDLNFIQTMKTKYKWELTSITTTWGPHDEHIIGFRDVLLGGDEIRIHQFPQPIVS